MLVFNYCDLILSRADSNRDQAEAGDNLIRDISAGKLCLRNAICKCNTITYGVKFVEIINHCELF